MSCAIQKSWNSGTSLMNNCTRSMIRTCTLALWNRHGLISIIHQDFWLPPVWPPCCQLPANQPASPLSVRDRHCEQEFWEGCTPATTVGVDAHSEMPRAYTACQQHAWLLPRLIKRLRSLRMQTVALNLKKLLERDISLPSTPLNPHPLNIQPTTLKWFDPKLVTLNSPPLRGPP